MSENDGGIKAALNKLMDKQIINYYIPASRKVDTHYFWKQKMDINAVSAFHW